MNALGFSFGIGLAVLAMVSAGAAEPAAGSIYTCVDAAGRKLTSDRPIAACVDRTQRELGPSGYTRRIIGPTLTEQERAEQAVIARKQQDERDRIAEERRRERVLIARYPNQKAHDTERSASLETIDAVIGTAEDRKLELKERRKLLDQELEFYRRDVAKAPVKLQRQLADNDAEMREQDRLISAQALEKGRINERFDKELVQLRTLWAARQTVPGVAAGIGASAR